MASIIDYSYFIGEINLPQAGNADGQAAITQFITIYEKEFLQLVLGYELWKVFTNGLVPVSPDQKWLDLRDGKEFTDISGNLIKWEGFKNTQKQSPIANYVYFHFMEDRVTDTAVVGEVNSSAENATRTSPAAKMSNAWNRMVDMICVLVDFLKKESATYPEFQNYPFPYRTFRKTNSFGV